MDLVFGWRTAVLSVAAATLVPLAFALWRSLRNRAAAQTLAACLVALIGVFTPWLIGFAGFYDQWRWLTFAPFANALLVPPLLYLHGYALAHGRWPSTGWRLLIPGLAQFIYQAVCFCLPLSFKVRWAHVTSASYDGVVAVALAVSFLVFGRRTLALLRTYRAALAGQRSDDALFAAGWIYASTVAFAAVAVIWAGYLLWDAASPLGYDGLLPLHLGIAAFALYLGISGWRHLAIPFPTFADLEPPVETDAPRDWEALGSKWAETTRERGWYRDEALSLPRLAALLGTNASYLSKALNQGLGVGFSEFVNGLRCDEVAAALRHGNDRAILDLAHDAGFASKASFNRCFRDRFGVTPSAMRSAGEAQST